MDSPYFTFLFPNSAVRLVRTSGMGLGGQGGKEKSPVIDRKALYCVGARARLGNIRLCLLGAELTQTSVQLFCGKLTSFSFPCGEGKTVVHKDDERYSGRR